MGRMLAYFARRIVGGAVTLFLVGLLMHSLVSFAPNKNFRLIKWGQDYRKGQELLRGLDLLRDLDKPWPVRYLAWLFDPTDLYTLPLELKEMQAVLDIELGGLRLHGSGVLTGDLGFSTEVEWGGKVSDMFGKGLGEFMLLLPFTLFAAMAFVFVQGRRRPPVPGLPNYPKSRHLLPQYVRPMRIPGL
jgi:hypothetical protein